ncbi:MAG: RNA polymerase sigma factor [Cytophagales bacterium]|nr:RNA polymerase sigma factor [Cytophagales bacterium]
MQEPIVLKVSKTITLEEQFNQIVNEYKERLYWHIRKIVIDHDDTDDILQETFVKVWNNLEGFREESSVYTWIYRIATNESLGFLRKKKRRSFFSLSNADYDLASKLDVYPFLEAERITHKLQKAILKLPTQQRLTFNMRYYDEMKFKDIAQILGKSEGAVKAHFHHARKKIETEMLDES